MERINQIYRQLQETADLTDQMAKAGTANVDNCAFVTLMNRHRELTKEASEILNKKWYRGSGSKVPIAGVIKCSDGSLTIDPPKQDLPKLDLNAFDKSELILNPFEASEDVIQMARLLTGRKADI
ncbi:hypothetical protein [Vibrio mediterranei]|uniref:hypothetical protein n=1 Tax=Vibrio mediterranei TaxID=689 RepID=UPI001EFDED64|nr:hypothetical protein [Vibrio mediterranei]MCG9657610.1 hypothetical protein [Vibrio mediterranei]